MVQAGPRAMDARRSRRRARSESESEGPFIHRKRFSSMQWPNTCVSFVHPQTVTEDPVHREFDMTLQDLDTESVDPSAR